MKKLIKTLEKILGTCLKHRWRLVQGRNRGFVARYGYPYLGFYELKQCDKCYKIKKF